MAFSKLALMDAYQLGFLAHALGRQGCVPDEFWLSYFSAHSAPKLAQLKPRELSNLLWAVAQWRVDLGAHACGRRGCRAGRGIRGTHTSG